MIKNAKWTQKLPASIQIYHYIYGFDYGNAAYFLKRSGPKQILVTLIMAVIPVDFHDTVHGEELSS